MKVFLSWSGDRSREIACAFRDWLPSVIQSIRPYVSSEDIDKGVRWSTDIAQELEESSFGILCITKDNIDAPWINFEAGALSKTIDKARVMPFLFDVKPAEVQGPLLQFQFTVHSKQDIGKLVLSLNNILAEEERLEETRVDKSFEVWWPQLEERLADIRHRITAGSDDSKESKPTGETPMLEELLALVRSQQKLLRSPEILLPPEYVAQVLRIVPDSYRPLGEDAFFAIHQLRGALHRVVMRMESLGICDDERSSMMNELLQAERVVSLLFETTGADLNIKSKKDPRRSGS